MLKKLLQKIQTILTVKQADFLRKYCAGEITTNDKDLFPKLLVSPNLWWNFSGIRKMYGHGL